MSDLRTAYDEVSRLLEAPEPFSVIGAVEEVRQFWRPKQVKTVLLAESHVFTSEDDFSIQLRADRLPLPCLPRSFVRFVHCLAYGENNLLERPAPANSGTWQYWRIFDACCNDPTGTTSRLLIKRYAPNFNERLAAKVALLQRMAERGIWLVDASIVGIYQPGGTRPSAAVVTNIIDACWELYIGNIITAAAPQRVVTIGNNIRDILGGRLRRLGVSVHELPQPQARLSVPEINAVHQSYFQFCQQRGGV